MTARTIRHKLTHKKTDREQSELGASDKFWKLSLKRRKQKTLSREALERKIHSGK